MTAIAIGPNGGFLNWTPNSGHATAAWVNQILKRAIEHYEDNNTQDPKERTDRALKEVYDTHRQADWDGYGALPINHRAYLEARQFLHKLPEDITLPTITADPRGAISLEWYKDSDWVFTLTMQGSGVVVYAGLMGKENRAYGTQKFSESIPKTILQSIRRIFP